VKRNSKIPQKMIRGARIGGVREKSPRRKAILEGGKKMRRVACCEGGARGLYGRGWGGRLNSKTHPSVWFGMGGYPPGQVGGAASKQLTELAFSKKRGEERTHGCTLEKGQTPE